MKNSLIQKAYIVPGNPQILLASEKSKGWASLKKNYDLVRQEIENTDADVILYFSTQWLSVIGYLFQADPKPEWLHVDANWHELGSIPYQFSVDTDFAKFYADEVRPLGHNAALVNYRGFPIDTGTIVAQKLLNPKNLKKAAMVSCNMYAEKDETVAIGHAGLRALQKSGKRAIAVLVSSFSNRLFTDDIDPKNDHIHSAKDHEWNQKVLELLAEGRLEDVSQVAREFGKEAHADLGFKGVWWLNALCGESNAFTGKVFDYQPVWGTGAALVGLTPTESITAKKLSTPSQNDAEFSENSDQVKPVEPVAHKTSSAPKIIDTLNAPEPVGAYPHARREGEFIFLSGVGPRERGKKEIPGVVLDSNRNIVSYDVEVQTRSVIQNVKSILEASGSSLDKVIDVSVYLTNMKADFQKFNAVYAETFSKIQATRTTVEVGSLPTPIAVEFKVIARA